MARRYICWYLAKVRKRCKMLTTLFFRFFPGLGVWRADAFGKTVMVTIVAVTVFFLIIHRIASQKKTNIGWQGDKRPATKAMHPVWGCQRVTGGWQVLLFKRLPIGWKGHDFWWIVHDFCFNFRENSTQSQPLTTVRGSPSTIRYSLTTTRA